MRRLKWAALLGTLGVLPIAGSARAETITIAPIENLQSPATLSPSGTGWIPDSTVAIHQCTIDLSICKLLTSAPTDPDGNFGPVEVTVTRTFTGDGGTVADCDTDECALVTRQDDDTLIAPLSFAPPPPPPPPPSAPAPIGSPPAASNAIGPPETRIVQGMKRTETGKATFRFTSDEANSSFECKLKGKDLKRRLRRFDDCSSPHRYKNLDSGRYRFKVRAIDAAGDVDPTPAKDRFRVVR